MLHYALVFLVVALIAAALGFGGIAGAAAGVAKILFVIFLVLFLASLVAADCENSSGRRYHVLRSNAEKTFDDLYRPADDDAAAERIWMR
jgi:uncharacterized membrane protein YtjA (UPF0391 family)